MLDAKSCYYAAFIITKTMFTVARLGGFFVANLLAGRFLALLVIALFLKFQALEPLLDLIGR